MLIRGLLSLLLCTGIATLANAQEPSASAISDSNNPLSDLIGIDFNNYFVPSLYGLEASANVMNIQGVFVPIQRHFFLDHIIRATMPVVTTPVSDAEYASGFGDFNIFDAFKFSKPEAKTEFGVGPLLVIPTASDDALGAGKWQLGAAVVVVRLMEGGSVAGALLTWQTDIAGDADREGTNLLTFQPNLALAIGRSGFYFSSSPIWTFDLENDNYLIPFSVGFGKVLTAGHAIVNVSAESQFSIYHRGEPQPSLQIYAAMQLQWKREGKPRPSSRTPLTPGTTRTRTQSRP
jgi:hypothetical protein